MAFPYSLPLATIPNGAAVSNTIYLGDSELIGIVMPSAWTAAALSFLVSVDNVNFFNMMDGTGNNQVRIVTPTATTYIAIGEEANIKFEHFRGAMYLQLQSGVSGATVNQGAARALTLVLKKSTTGAF